jgi:predicted NBD/HSP70 family sugar kinase
VVDIGGSRVKVYASASEEQRSFESGSELTPDLLMTRLSEVTSDWKYDVVSLGYPGAASPDGLASVAGNLGEGWIGFDFEQAFGHPVRVVNDAAMQALGAYAGGRMLFLGLGTGLGSTIIADRVIVRLELGSLPHRSGGTLAQRLGKDGLSRIGIEEWQKDVEQVTQQLRRACAADYVVLGGGNAARVDPLPPHTRRGHNDDAFTGGVRLWEEWLEHHDAPPSDIWRVVW